LLGFWQSFSKRASPAVKVAAATAWMSSTGGADFRRKPSATIEKLKELTRR
jgi:hypothetical protein